MADIDGIPPTTNWQFRPTRLRAYEALYTLNRCFEATLMSLEHLERLEIFRPEFLNGFKLHIVHTRALANEELTSSLQDYEQHESGRTDIQLREWERQNSDPDDVFIHALHRKQEIKDEIRYLQDALKRQRPSRRRKKTR